MRKLATSFLLGASVAFLLAGYKAEIVMGELSKEAYGLGVKDMAEICKSATDKLAEMEAQ